MLEPNTDATLARDVLNRGAEDYAAEAEEIAWWNGLSPETRENVEALLPDGRVITRLYWKARRMGRL